MKRSTVFLFGLIGALLSPMALQAQSLWTSAEIKIKAAGGLNVFAEGDYRTHDGVSGTERWSGTAGLDYKVCRYLKLTAGYTYIHQRTQTEITKKGNIIPPYWQPKHRAYFAVTGSYDWKRFTFSLRERYQYTYRTEQYVPKFDDDGVTPKDDELIEAKHKHVLRSRLEVEYNIRKSGFSPFVSCELYNSLTEGFGREKTRWTVGSAYKFNKHHSVNLYYRYISQADSDEADGHVIGIGYRFKL